MDAFDTGWYLGAFGYHDPNDTNYTTGFLPQFYGEFRDFFAFDLGSLSGDDTVIDATFKLYTANIVTSDPFETVQIVDVTTPVAEVVAGGSDRFDIFDDLGTGAIFATRDVLASELYTMIEFDLNAEAIAAINAARGQDFALGGVVTTIDFAGWQQNVFGASENPAFPKQLELTLADPDFYKITVDGSSPLVIETSTPAGGSGEFVNELDPIVRVYDAARHLVASDDNGADGRNALLVLDLSAGDYFIEVVGAGDTTGEYVLSVQPATPALLQSDGDGEADGGALLRVNPDEKYPSFNRNRPADVSNDGHVSAIDALMIINRLNKEGARSLPQGAVSESGQRFYDVNRDGYISPIDALQVINHLNNPEKESGVAEVLQPDDSATVPQAPSQNPVVLLANRKPVAKQATGPVAGQLTRPLPHGPSGEIAPPAGDQLAAHIWGGPEQDWIVPDSEPALSSLASDVAGAWHAGEPWGELMYQLGLQRRPEGDKR